MSSKHPQAHCIPVVVVGTGSIGIRHLKVLNGAVNTRAWAIPLRPERMADLVQDGYTTVPDLITAATQGARHAIVATDTRRHLVDAESALALNMAVLVEKPVAPDAQAAYVLSRRATHAGLPLFVGCVLRFSETINKFRVQLPRIGRIHAVRIECQSYLPDWRPGRPYRETYSARAGEGGVLRDLIHEIDYAAWIFGWPTAVEGHVRNLGRLDIEADESVELLWTTGAGAVVSIGLDYLSRPIRRRMRASGEHGTLEWDGVAGRVTLALAGEPELVFQSGQTMDEMLRAQDLAFVEAGNGGSADARLATGLDGARTLAICEAARRSSDTRREEKVGYAEI